MTGSVSTLERMAMALYESEWSESEQLRTESATWEKLGRSDRNEYVAHARAALQAIRGVSRFDGETNRRLDFAIDAILSEGAGE